MSRSNLYTRGIILILSIGLASLCAKSQVAPKSKPIIQFQHLQNGLADSQISSIIMDHMGFIWIGSMGGLHKYDGNEFELYLSTDDINSLPDSYITHLYEDQEGKLWIGTAEGMCVYNRNKNNFIRYRTKSTKEDEINPNLNRIRSIIEDDNGVLWVASEGEGLFYFETKKQLFIPYPFGNGQNEISTKRVASLEMDSQGTLWIGTLDEGIFMLNISTGNLIQVKEVNISGIKYFINPSWVIVEDKDETIWIGTKGMGLFSVSRDSLGKRTFKHYQYNADDSKSIMNNEIYSMKVDSQGRLWVGNENGGLHLYDKEHDNFYRYVHDPSDPTSLSHNSVWCIYEDNKMRLWVGTALQGVNIYDQLYSKFEHYKQMPDNIHGLNNSVVRDFWEEDNGNIWIATDGGGLNYFNRKSNEFYHYLHDPQKPESIRANAVLGLCEDAEGNLWASTWSGGLNVLYDRKKMKFRHLRADGFRNYMPMNHFFSLMKDDKDNIWAANFSTGLAKYDWDKREFEMYFPNEEDSNGLNSSLLTTLFQDSKGSIWAGTEAFGLNKLINQNGVEIFVKYLNDPGDSTSLAGNVINDMFEDSRGLFWIATNEGLSKFNYSSETFTNYTVKDGLPDDNIKSIVEDDHGVLWLGTNNGIARFDLVNDMIRSYNQNDGLQGNEFCRYAVKKLSTGELIFGGKNGFNIFHPDSVSDNPFRPEVYLTEFKIFNEPVEIGNENSPIQKHISLVDELILTHNQGVFSFEFTALNYTRSENNQYAFRLEGLEEQWNYVGSQRNASYSNLDAGEYVFHVKASNNDGVWNDEGKSLKIIVLPPWWRTWWSYIIFVCITVIIIYVTIRRRTAYLSEQRKILKKMVKLRTKELKEKNEQIAMQSEELLSYNESLNSLNDNLEKKVHDRTNLLITKNKKLSEYAFMNAHNLRVPVANIKGLVQLFNEKSSKKELLELARMLKGQSNDLDKVLYDIKNMLEKQDDLH